MQHSLTWLLALSLGGLLGGLTYVALVADPLFAGMIVLFWTLGTGLSLELLAPLSGDIDDWAGARWAGAAGGLMALAATFGISPTLPVSADLRLGLGLFVVGAWLTALNVGLALGTETQGQSVSGR